jgi:transcriptional regulator with XRE-family HTH domain
MFAGGDAGVRIKGGDVRMRVGNVRRREMPGGRGEDERNMFAQEMIAMRNQRGWTQEETAAKMLVSTSTIANIESGYRPPTAAQAAKADEVFGTPGTFQRHEQRMRGIPFSAGFRPFQPYEEEARVLRMFEHTLVPGLFQTESYARVLAEAYLEASDQDVKDRVDARMARQAILSREDPPPPRVWAVIDEQVLYRGIGGPAVMLAQVEHLAELARMQKITIQVIPATCPHPGLLGAFVVAETDQPTAIVYLETASEGQTVEDPDMAESMTLMFDALRTEALTGSASLKLIEEAIQRWKEQTDT